MKLEENYFYISRPLLVILLTLLVLGCGIMIGSALFPVREQAPCKIRHRVIVR